MEVVIVIIILVFAFFIGFYLGRRKVNEVKNELENYRKNFKTADEIINQARKEANAIIENEKKKLEGMLVELQRKEGEIKAKEIELESKEKILKNKEVELALKEKEFLDKKKNSENELQKSKRELEDRMRKLEQFERELNNRENELKAKEKNLELKFDEVNKKLEEVARMTMDEARMELLKSIEISARYEAAQLAHKIREETRLKADREAKEIIAQAIQRCASTQTSETTITVVEIPSDDIKGRIIGREGRNIRAFESITGVEVIIDDTPEIIVLSSFDAIRREKARICITRLIEDGRIHPARIEEIYKKVEEEFESHIKAIGEETVLELGIRPIAEEIVYYIGKMKYRASYGQNLLLHSIETAKLASIIASELGFDKDIAKRAGLLHDIGKVLEDEGPHAIVGGQFLKRYGESDIVVNAVMAHHGDVEPISPYAPVVAAADAISGSRPGARRESIEKYIQRIKRLEDIAYSYEGVQKAFAIQAGRELRVLVDANKVSDVQAYEIAKNISKRIEEEMEFPGMIKVVVIREKRVEEYAK